MPPHFVIEYKLPKYNLFYPQHILSTFFGHLLCCLSYAPLLVAMVLSRICFTFVISSRTYLMGTLWFTKLDESNQYAVAARNTGVPSFIMYFISMVVLSVASFFNLAKNDKFVENSN